MGVLIKAFFAALLAFVALLVIAEMYIPELSEMDAMATEKKRPSFDE